MRVCRRFKFPADRKAGDEVLVRVLWQVEKRPDGDLEEEEEGEAGGVDRGVKQEVLPAL